MRDNIIESGHGKIGDVVLFWVGGWRGWEHYGCIRLYGHLVLLGESHVLGVACVSYLFSLYMHRPVADPHVQGPDVSDTVGVALVGRGVGVGWQWGWECVGALPSSHSGQFFKNLYPLWRPLLEDLRILECGNDAFSQGLAAAAKSKDLSEQTQRSRSLASHLQPKSCS